LRVVV